jgi:hypothetical protein
MEEKNTCIQRQVFTLALREAVQFLEEGWKRNAGTI